MRAGGTTSGPRPARSTSSSAAAVPTGEGSDALRLEALDKPRTAPWSDEQVLARAGQLALDDASGMHYWVRFYQNIQPNVVMAPSLTDAVGGLVLQTTASPALCWPTTKRSSS